MKRITIENYKVYEATPEARRLGGVRVEIVTETKETYYVESPMLANLLLEDYEDGVRTPLNLLIDGRNTVEGATRSEAVAAEWVTTEPKPVTSEPKPSTETAKTEKTNPVLDWFEKKKPNRYSGHDARVNKIPAHYNVVALDTRKHRYCIYAGKIYKFAALKSGGFMQQHFGNAAFAPEFVKETLNQCF